MTLYHLSLHDPETSYDDYDEAFFIGVFRAAEEAEQTARRYLASVPGFKDHPCVSSIAEKPVHGESIREDRVYWVEGWNWNEQQDEVDVVQSDDFASKTDAEEALTKMKREHPCTEWTVASAPLCQCYWQEGFERYTYITANPSS